MRRQKTPEGYVQSAILELLAVEKIWAVRLNSRTVHLPGFNGKTRPVYFGLPGMGDILATPITRAWTRIDGVRDVQVLCQHPALLWIECKAPRGKQSEAQQNFEVSVRAAGHFYLLARSVDDVRDWLSKHR